MLYLMSFHLNNTQIEQFNREGFLLVEELFTGDDLQPVIDEITLEIDLRAADLVAAGKLSQTYEQDDFEHRLVPINNETNELATSIWNGALNGPQLFHLIRHEKLLDVAESLCGPEIVASSVYRLRPKLPDHGYSSVPWHQDSGYFEPYCDSSLIVTVWLPLVDATRERGCLWLLPGVHRGGNVLEHRRRSGLPYLELTERGMPATEPLCVPVSKGGVLLLHNLTPHASFENRSDAVRWSFDFRYQSASLPTNAHISQKGDDTIANGSNAVPAACYPPEADFLVRSQLRPDEVITDPEDFHRIREGHLAGPAPDRWRQ